jgi:transposase
MLRREPLCLDAASRRLYERFVPESHPLRRLDAAVDFSFVLPLVADRYNPWIGRPAEHPERLWRLLFAQYYLNLSDRKVCLAAHESLALRWFLRLNADESPPHPTTLQKFRFRRLDEGVYLRIHFRLLEQASERGVLSREERQIYDTSHVHANTRVSSVAALLPEARARVVKEVATTDAAFGEELAAEAAADRAAYRAERERRRAADQPKPTKEEKDQAAVGTVVRTPVALALLGTVVADRADTRLIVNAPPGCPVGERWDRRTGAADPGRRTARPTPTCRTRPRSPATARRRRPSP